jgi:hypothetical protein
MPKAWPEANDDAEDAAGLAAERQLDFQHGLDMWQGRFRRALSETRPVSDYMGALTLSTALGGLFGTLVESMINNGWSDRKALAAVLLLILYMHLWKPFMEATDAAVEIAMLRFANAMGMPFPHTMKSATCRTLWFGTATFISFVVPAGTGFIGYEFAKNVIELMKPPLPPLP